MSLEYLIGVDLGQAHDYTAVTILERLPNTGENRTPKAEALYRARHLERFPLGTSYPKQVERIAALVAATKHIGAEGGKGASVRIVVDQTGVGRPVVDMLRAAGLHELSAVTIHGGDQTIRDGRDYRVPKRELVSILQVLLQGRRLEIAAALPLAQTLQKEMLAFKVEISNSGHDTYGNDWRDNPHDDLVLSAALAAWAVERARAKYHFEI